MEVFLFTAGFLADRIVISMTKAAVAKLPPVGTRHPVRISESSIRKAAPNTARGVVSLSFAHRPDRLDLTRPGTLAPQDASISDRVGLHFHCTAGSASVANGVELIGTRKPVPKSQARDYVLVFVSDAWYLQPVSDSITGIKPVPNGSPSTPAPKIPNDYVPPSDLEDPDPWNSVNNGAAVKSHLNGPTQIRPRKSSPFMRGGLISARRSSPVVQNGGRQLASGSVSRVTENNDEVEVSASDEEKDAALRAALASDDEDDLNVDDNEEMVIEAAVEDDADQAPPVDNVNGRATVGTKGQKSLGLPRHSSRTADSSDSDSGSESSGSSNSSGSSGSSSSGSSDSVEYTDGSGESDSE